MNCERCTQPYDPPVNRPSWPRCMACTLTPAHAALSRSTQGAPAYPLPPATPNEVQWIVPGPPLSINRVYRMGFRGGKRIMYFTEQGRAYKLSVAAHALQALGRIHWDRTRRYALTLALYFDNARADSDNPLKVIKDALQGVLWDNDVQVISDHTDKVVVPKGDARVVITVAAR